MRSLRLCTLCSDILLPHSVLLEMVWVGICNTVRQALSLLDMMVL